MDSDGGTTTRQIVPPRRRDSLRKAADHARTNTNADNAARQTEPEPRGPASSSNASDSSNNNAHASIDDTLSSSVTDQMNTNTTSHSTHKQQLESRVLDESNRHNRHDSAKDVEPITTHRLHHHHPESVSHRSERPIQRHDQSTRAHTNNDMHAKSDSKDLNPSDINKYSDNNSDVQNDIPNAPERSDNTRARKMSSESETETPPSNRPDTQERVRPHRDRSNHPKRTSSDEHFNAIEPTTETRGREHHHSDPAGKREQDSKHRSDDEKPALHRYISPSRGHHHTRNPSTERGRRPDHHQTRHKNMDDSSDNERNPSRHYKEDNHTPHYKTDQRHAHHHHHTDPEPFSKGHRMLSPPRRQQQPSDSDPNNHHQIKRHSHDRDHARHRNASRENNSRNSPIQREENNQSRYNPDSPRTPTTPVTPISHQDGEDSDHRFRQRILSPPRDQRNAQKGNSPHRRDHPDRSHHHRTNDRSSPPPPRGTPSPRHDDIEEQRRDRYLSPQRHGGRDRYLSPHRGDRKHGDESPHRRVGRSRSNQGSRNNNGGNRSPAPRGGAGVTPEPYHGDSDGQRRQRFMSPQRDGHKRSDASPHKFAPSPSNQYHKKSTPRVTPEPRHGGDSENERPHRFMSPHRGHRDGATRSASQQGHGKSKTTRTTTPRETPEPRRDHFDDERRPRFVSPHRNGNGRFYSSPSCFRKTQIYLFFQAAAMEEVDLQQGVAVEKGIRFRSRMMLGKCLDVVFEFISFFVSFFVCAAVDLICSTYISNNNKN
ncbi:hypothetical protein BJ741DRAFT_629022 [Chytriomyces cf. hyalinus JEL632]|nr:hypothetical protein BJ741DRAFT_629022 [Chytriomyces cf. hyalinus JEL632]